MGLPPFPGPGRYELTLATPAFFLLVTLVFLFGLMLWYLRIAYPRHKRGLEGYFEAAGIDIAFLGVAVGLVVLLGIATGHGNRSAWAIYEVVLGGYWLTFAIPVVTVSSSVESRSRGRIPWLLPSVLIAIAMFGALFLYYYYGG